MPHTLKPGAAVSLDDRFALEEGRVFLSGIQALVRLPVDQARHDARAGRRVGTFITGYPGSPLGGYDIALRQAREVLQRHDIRHQPGTNEELAATALMGTQLLDRYPHERYDGVTGVWYGKGPGLDRSGDAIRHGNFAGTSRHGAVVILSGEDHEAKSSTLPYEQEYAFAHAGIPVLYPSSVEEFLVYGRHAVELSRYSGLWVALKLVGALCDGGQTIDLPGREWTPVLPAFEVGGRPFRKWQDNQFFPGRTIETERHVFTERHPAALAYLRANGIDACPVRGPRDTLGLVTAGKSHADTLQALADLGLDERALNDAGVRVIKLGAIYPVDAAFLRDATRGLHRLVVVEEKRGTLEEKVKEALYNVADRPIVLGKRDEDGAPLFPEYGFLDADLIAERLGPPLAPLLGDDTPVRRRLDELAAVRARSYANNRRRTPNYCSGCPHNVSTQLLDGQVAWGAPGCHVFAAIMDDQPQRSIDALFQFGGEGAAWIGLSPYTDLDHVFQNQGDGSLFHSSHLNIRACVAAGVKMTFKVLFNGYVANTGGQEAVGATDVPRLAHQLALEGVTRIAVIASDPAAYRGADMPAIASVHDAREIDAVLADLAATDGVTIFLYDGECANERRRRRKRGSAPPAERFVAINEDVCENCGDCGAKTNCMSLQKTQTEFGTKTRIHQSSCNQDTACITGDCPSFVSVVRTAGARKPVPPPLAGGELPEPDRPTLDGPFHVYVPGVGGTGVLTLNALLAWATLIEGHEAMSYDQTGAAQKWGAVLSSLVISPRGERAPANKVGVGKADLYFTVDAMAGADPVNLDRCAPARTAALVNTGLFPSGEMVRQVDALAPVAPMVDSILSVTQRDRAVRIDAKRLADGLFGDYMAANVIALGAAYQAGLVPISADSIEAAIVVNRTAKEQNLQAFRYGRLAIAAPERVAALLDGAPPGRAAPPVPAGDLPAEHARLLAVRVAELTAYQDAAYAQDYVAFVRAVAARERARLGDDAPLAVTEAVIRCLHKLMAYKDEYEVARLHLRRAGELRASFEGEARMTYHLHPPLLRALGLERKLAVPERVASPLFGTLVRMRRLRGTRLDPFGATHGRRTERELVGWYRRLVDDALDRLDPGTLPVVLELARLPDGIRGYEDIKLASVARARERAAALTARLDTPTPITIIQGAAR